MVKEVTTKHYDDVKNYKELEKENLWLRKNL